MRGRRHGSRNVELIESSVSIADQELRSGSCARAGSDCPALKLEWAHRVHLELRPPRFQRSPRRFCCPADRSLHRTKQNPISPLPRDSTRHENGMQAAQIQRSAGFPDRRRLEPQLSWFNACALPPIYYMRSAAVDWPQNSKRRMLDDIPAQAPTQRRKRCR